MGANRCATYTGRSGTSDLTACRSANANKLAQAERLRERVDTSPGSSQKVPVAAERKCRMFICQDEQDIGFSDHARACLGTARPYSDRSRSAHTILMSNTQAVHPTVDRVARLIKRAFQIIQMVRLAVMVRDGSRWMVRRRVAYVCQAALNQC